MTQLRARVANGCIVLDEPTALPEGTVLDLVVDDEGDDLTDEDRRVLLSDVVLVLTVWHSQRGQAPLL